MKKYESVMVRPPTKERLITMKEAHKFKNQDELVNRALDSLSREIKNK